MRFLNGSQGELSLALAGVPISQKPKTRLFRYILEKKQLDYSENVIGLLCYVNSIREKLQ